MGIGKMNDDYTFYEGYEGEPEVVISLLEDDQKALHVWEGYMEDLFANPSLEGEGWLGFTRDIHQFEGAFSEEGSGAVIDPDEYLADIMNYADAEFEYPETADVKDAIVELLTHAIAINGKVRVDRNE